MAEHCVFMSLDVWMGLFFFGIIMLRLFDQNVTCDIHHLDTQTSSHPVFFALGSVLKSHNKQTSFIHFVKEISREIIIKYIYINPVVMIALHQLALELFVALALLLLIDFAVLN